MGDLKLEAVFDGLCIFETNSHKPKDKVFGFDLDWTLIHPTKSFSSMPNDYYLFPDRIEKISELIDDGYEIVIFTSCVGSIVELIKAKMHYVIEMLSTAYHEEIPILILCAFEREKCKPGIYMMEFFRENFNNKYTEFKYCGDTAGRFYTDAKGNRYAIDYNDNDKKFIEYYGYEFLIPEQLFYQDPITISGKQEIIVMIGMPAGARVWLCKNFIVGKCKYKIVQESYLKSYEKCLSVTEYYLQKGFSVVIDNTNPSSVTRIGYVKIGEKYSMPVRYVFVADDGQFINSQHKKPISDAAYKRYITNFEYPTDDEGYDELIIWWCREYNP